MNRVEPGQSSPIDPHLPCQPTPERQRVELNPLESLESLEPPHSTTKLFIEDLGGFIKNLFLWPVHGYHLLTQQIFYCIFFPILLPLTLFEVILDFYIYVFSCGLINISKEPQFEPSSPTRKRETDLATFAIQQGSEDRFAISHGRLLHHIDTYLDFATTYSKDTLRGKANDHTNCLIKVQVGQSVKLFQFHPDQPKESILSSYLAFIQANSSDGTHVQHTFALLDYSYFLGMYRVKTKTDLLNVTMRERVARPQTSEVDTNEGYQEEEEHRSCTACIRRCLRRLDQGQEARLEVVPDQIPLDNGAAAPPPPLLLTTQPPNRTTGGRNWKHTREDHQTTEGYAIWPGYTREICRNVINKSLKGEVLSKNHISLYDMDHLVTL